MNYSYHRRSLLALAALPLIGAAAQAAEVSPTPHTLDSNEMVGKMLRVIKPGDMVTMDYSESRVNVEVDEQGKIIKVYVG